MTHAEWRDLQELRKRAAEVAPGLVVESVRHEGLEARVVFSGCGLAYAYSISIMEWHFSPDGAMNAILRTILDLMRRRVDGPTTPRST